MKNNEITNNGVLVDVDEDFICIPDLLEHIDQLEKSLAEAEEVILDLTKKLGLYEE